MRSWLLLLLIVRCACEDVPFFRHKAARSVQHQEKLPLQAGGADCPALCCPPLCTPPRSVLRKVPDMLESFAERAPTLLEDRSHSVLLAGVTLMLDICAQAPQVGGWGCNACTVTHGVSSIACFAALWKIGQLFAYQLQPATNEAAVCAACCRGSPHVLIALLPAQVVEAYRPHVPLLCRVLRSLIMGGFAPGEQLASGCGAAALLSLRYWYVGRGKECA